MNRLFGSDYLGRVVCDINLLIAQNHKLVTSLDFSGLCNAGLICPDPLEDMVPKLLLEKVLQFCIAFTADEVVPTPRHTYTKVTGEQSEHTRPCSTVQR